LYIFVSDILLYQSRAKFLKLLKTAAFRQSNTLNCYTLENIK